MFIFIKAIFLHQWIINAENSLLYFSELGIFSLWFFGWKDLDEWSTFSWKENYAGFETHHQIFSILKQEKSGGILTIMNFLVS